MFRTKHSVDRHVQELFRKVKDENERTLRCYNIAKLYYQVQDYESARRYVSCYLELKGDQAGPHKLLGEIYEALGQKESALAQYKQSLEIESRQDDLVLKVCELLADMDVALDINRVKYWVDRADAKFPHHPTVFQLKEKILTVDRPNNGSEDLEALIAAELSARPSDVQLRVKLLKYYMDKSRLDDAYKHALEVESTHAHRDSVAWYEALCDLLTKCKEVRQQKWTFWILYVSSLERYATLSLKEQGHVLKKTVSEAAQAVFNFDQALTEAKLQNFPNTATFAEHMFSHMWGQLHYQLACLLLRKTKREQGSWSDAGRLCAPLLLTAMHVAPFDTTAPWAQNIKDPTKAQIQLWRREGSYRCSQAGHVLQDYARDDTKRLMDKIDKFCIGSWRERIYQRIFVSKAHISTSYFANHAAPNPPLRICSATELKLYDQDNTSERTYSMYFRINDQEPWKVADLDLQTYVKLKLNDHFALQYVKDRVPNEDSIIEGLLRSIDGVDYAEVVISPKSPSQIAAIRKFGSSANSSTTIQGFSRANAMEYSDDLDETTVSSSQDKITEPAIRDVSAGVDNVNHMTQNTRFEKKDEHARQLKFECEKHPQLDGKFFAVIYEESNIDGPIVAKCQLCKNHKKIRGSLKSLSNYTTHLKRAHDDEYSGYKSYIQEKRAKLIEDEGPSKRAACKFSQTKFEENVTNYILDSMAPLRTVDMPSFRKIFDDFGIKKNGEPLKHLSRRTLGRKIVENFEDRMATIRNDIDARAVTVCTTADVWSNNCRRFLGVTAHWINPSSLRRESAAIACRRFSGIHSYDRIACMLTEIHSSFNLDAEKVLAVVTDNGSNFVKAFKVFGVNMPDDFFFRSNLTGFASGCRYGIPNEDDESESDSEHPAIVEDIATYENMPDNDRQSVELPKHFRCASHTLNLIATTDALKAIKSSKQLSRSHGEAMDRCTELWRMTRSPKKHEVLKEALGVALMKPVVVRWNSLYDALAQLIALKDKISALSETIGIGYPLRESDFKYIENYVECLRPIAEAVDKLQGEDFCHYGFLLPTLITISRRLTMLSEKNTLQSHLPIIQNLITGLEMRFANFFQIEKEGEYAAIAAISHPRFKAQWLGFFPGNIQEKVRTVVINAAQYELQADILSPRDSQSEDHSDFFDFGPSTATFGRSNTTFRNEDPEVQIIQYTKERSTDLTLLESYPLIKKLFVRFNTPLPSSAPVERLFSFATMMDLPKYNRLSDINFERRVLSVANAMYAKKTNSK